MKKFEISLASTIKAGTPLMMQVNERCLLSQDPRVQTVTQVLRPQVEAQATLLQSRAYSHSLKTSYTYAQLKSLADEDPCLIQISEDREIFLDATTVNDPSFALQSHLTAIEAPASWDTFYSSLTGSVVIAIIDDGIALAHPDLSGILWTNPGEIAGNSIDDDGNGYVDDVNGYNFGSNIGSPAHESGKIHGTHVAGLAAAQDNNAVGVTGVMGRNVKIMALNVVGSAATGGGAAIINALAYATANGAKVINISMGGQGSYPPFIAALSKAATAGAFVAISAGNSNELVTATNLYVPMGYAKDIDGVISVGSTDALTGLRSSFSNYSTTYVEIGAPGSDSTKGGLLSTYPPNLYQTLQGTSMSSPVVAGSAALVVGWLQARGKSATPAQIETLLKASANSNGALTTYFLGGGALNLKNLAAATLCNF